MVTYNLPMDERTPAEHHRRPHRRRRLTATLFASIVLALALITTPAAKPVQRFIAPIVPPAVTQTTSNVTQDVLQDQPGLAHVTRDIDGDTIVVELNGKSETVRFIGMDTPETHDPRKPVQCFGPEAAAHTKALLEGQNVRLAADPEDSDRDKYGRLLRYVYLPDGELVNAELVQDGYAFAYVVFPFSKIDDFRALENEAHAAGRGLWSTCNVNSSDIIKQTAGPKS